MCLWFIHHFLFRFSSSEFGNGLGETWERRIIVFNGNCLFFTRLSSVFGRVPSLTNDISQPTTDYGEDISELICAADCKPYMNPVLVPLMFPLVGTEPSFSEEKPPASATPPATNLGKRKATERCDSPPSFNSADPRKVPKLDLLTDDDNPFIPASVVVVSQDAPVLQDPHAPVVIVGPLQISWRVLNVLPSGSFNPPTKVFPVTKPPVWCPV